MIKRFLLAAVFALCAAPAARAQEVIVPSTVPTCTNLDVLVWDSALVKFKCAAASSVSQPLTDALGLIRNATDGTKVLKFNLAGLTTATERTWTIPDANITIPSTIASLGANTFTGAQTATSFSGLGTSLTALNASELLSGTVPLARLVGVTNTEISAAAAIAYSKLALVGSIIDADVNASAAIVWSKISKTGSSLADLTTRSAADLSSGTLASARLVGAYTGITGLGTLTELNTTGHVTLTAGSSVRWGTTFSEPKIRNSGSALIFEKADGSGYAGVTAESFDLTQFLRVGPSSAQTGAVQLPNGSSFGLRFRNGSNTADIGALYLDGTNQLIVSEGALNVRFNTTGLIRLGGGDTSAFPALKRSGTYIEARLADDSGYAHFYGLTFSTPAGGYFAIGASPATVGSIRLSANEFAYYRDGANDRSMIGAFGGSVYVGNAQTATRFQTSLATPGSLANGDVWVDCLGTTPSRVCAIKVQDGGVTHTIGSITF